MGSTQPVQKNQPPEYLSFEKVVTEGGKYYKICLDVYQNRNTYWCMLVCKTAHIGSAVFLVLSVSMFIHGSSTNSVSPLIVAVLLYQYGSNKQLEAQGEDIHTKQLITQENLNKAVFELQSQSKKDRAAHMVEKQELKDAAAAQLAEQKEQAATQLAEQKEQAATQLAEQKEQAAAQLAEQKETNSDLKTTVNTLAAAGGENLKQQLEVLEKLETLNLTKEQLNAINKQINKALDDKTLSENDRSRWTALYQATTSHKKAMEQLATKMQTSRTVLGSKLSRCGSTPDTKENTSLNPTTTHA